MNFTDQEKMELIKRILIGKIESVDSYEALKTLIGPVAWTKLMNFLEQKLQAEADQCDIISQEALDRKAKILALKDEKDNKD